MDIFPFFIVLVSTITHGIWNFLAKKAEDKDIAAGLSKVSEAILFFIPFVVVLSVSGGYGYAHWYFFVLVASCFVFLNYYCLARTYEQIDLSIAYPIARSSTLYLPILGYLFLGERIDLIGLIAVGMITFAVLIIQLNSFARGEIKLIFNRLARPGSLFALLAAFVVASYTIWDKMAVSHIKPFLYFYSYTFLAGVFYLTLLLIKFPLSKIRHEWRRHKFSILAMGVLNTFTYLLVLVALGMSKASYVGALRQVSMVVGVILGRRFLDEALPFPKILGVILLIGGSILITFAK